MLVERSIYGQAVQTAIDTAALSVVDVASKEGRHIGPVVSQLQYHKIQHLIGVGIDESLVQHEMILSEGTDSNRK